MTAAGAKLAAGVGPPPGGAIAPGCTTTAGAPAASLGGLSGPGLAGSPGASNAPATSRDDPVLGPTGVPGSVIVGGSGTTPALWPERRFEGPLFGVATLEGVMITTGAPGGEPGAPATPGTVIVVPGFTTMTGDPPGNPGVLLAEGAAGTAGPVPGPTPVPGFTIITGDPAGNPGDAIGTVGPVPGPTPVPRHRNPALEIGCSE
jgi:hypothetical protein